MMSTIPFEVLSLQKIYDHPGHLLRRANQILFSVFESEFGEMGINPNGLIILAVLYHHPGVDLGALAYGAAIDKSSCGRTVSALERDGLVKVTKNISDARQKSVFLTAAGRDLYYSCAAGVERVEKQFLACFDEQQREVFMRDLKTFVTFNNDLSRAPFREVTEA